MADAASFVQSLLVCNRQPWSAVGRGLAWFVMPFAIIVTWQQKVWKLLRPGKCGSCCVQERQCYSSSDGDGGGCSALPLLEGAAVPSPCWRGLRCKSPQLDHRGKDGDKHLVMRVFRGKRGGDWWIGEQEKRMRLSRGKGPRISNRRATACA
eukprot:354384-Chlamydomonas_euryale.AAC.2